MSVTSSSAPTGALPDDLRPGFADAVGDAQRAFRAALDAFASPGRIVTLGETLDPPAPLAPATAALCLALADIETPLWLDGAAGTRESLGFLRFHCGAPITANPREAAFAVIADGQACPPLDGFALGTDELPERAATLLIQVSALEADGGRPLSGPGIRGMRRLGVDGLAPSFWTGWRNNHALFPYGIDVVLIAGTRIAALPRTTRVGD